MNFRSIFNKSIFFLAGVLLSAPLLLLAAPPFIINSGSQDVFVMGSTSTFRADGAVNVGGTLTVGGASSFTGALVPAADDAHDLGTSVLQWQDLFIDGTASIDILTVDVGPTTLTAGDLVMGAAASQLVPGATSFSIRNTTDAADNLLVSNAGLVTVAAGLTITTADLTFGATASEIVPGATSLSLRNNADDATNLSIADAGAITFRGTLIGTGTSALGWAVVNPADNAACTTGCVTPAVFGIDLAGGATAPVIVDATDAAADVCLCAGAT